MKMIFRWYINALSSHKKEALIGFTYVILIAFLSVLIPALIKIFLEQLVVGTFNIFYLITGLVIFTLILFIKTFFNMQWYVSLDDFGGKYITDLSMKCQASVEKAYLEDIETISFSTLKHVLYYDVLEVFRVIAHHIPTIVGSIFVIVFSLSLAFFYSFTISILVLVSLIIGVLISVLSRNIISKKASSTNEKMKDVHGVVSEFTDAISSIQTNLTIGYYNKKISRTISSFIATAKKEDRVIYFWSGVMQNYSILFSIVLSAVLAFSLSGNAIVNFAFFTILANIVMSEGQKIESMLHQTVKSKVCFLNINRVLTLKKKKGDFVLNSIDRLEFDDVSFSYGKDTPLVLSHLSFDLVSGDCVRIVGPNGAGKSSIVKILSRLYKVNSGQVRVNHSFIDDIDSKWLYSKMLYINQDDYLMNDSIVNYIIENSDVQSVEEIHRHLKSVNLEDKQMISNGSNLSAGQRKKILFMKAKIKAKEADLIIFDEITSGMDVDTQKEFAEFVNSIIRDSKKIVIIIDHNDLGRINYNKEICVI